MGTFVASETTSATNPTDTDFLRNKSYNLSSKHREIVGIQVIASTLATMTKFKLQIGQNLELDSDVADVTAVDFQKIRTVNIDVPAGEKITAVGTTTGAIVAGLALNIVDLE